MKTLELINRILTGQYFNVQLVLKTIIEKARQQYVSQPPHVFYWGRYIDSCIGPSKLSQKKFIWLG